MKKIATAILIALLAFMTFVAWHNSQPPNCVTLTDDHNKWVCTIIIKQ